MRNGTSQNPDVVVIGGGLIGLLTAAELAERDACVVVLEKDDVGFEQSGRSAAAVNLPGGAAREGCSMLRRAAEGWAIFEDRWGCKIDTNDGGFHVIVQAPEDEAWIDTERSTWRQIAGYPEGEVLDSAAARARYPSLAGPFVSIDVRHGGHVDPALVLKGLQEVAGRLGIEIRRGTAATGFERSGDTITAVRTGEMRVPCGDVIVAAGVWSASFCRRLGFALPMQRVRSPIAETGPVPGNVIPGFLRAGTFGARQNRNGTIRITGGYRRSAMLHDITFSDLRGLKTWGPSLWRNRRDVSLRVAPRQIAADASRAVAQLRFGGRRTIVPQQYEPPSSARLRQPQLQGLVTLVPSLAGARIHRAFAGIVDLTPDFEPVIGRIPGIANGFVSTGYSGHGFMYAPGACEGLARLVLDKDPGVELGRYAVERFSDRVQTRKQMF